MEGRVSKAWELAGTAKFRSMKCLAKTGSAKSLRNFTGVAKFHNLCEISYDFPSELWTSLLQKININMQKQTHENS